jgi:hypothetical protein
MRKSMIAIFAGLIVIVSADQSYADKQKEYEKCVKVCKAAHDKCIVKVTRKDQPARSQEQRECGNKMKACEQTCQDVRAGPY